MADRFRMFAGPNGSGKSTLIDTIRHDCNIGYFINADNIQEKLNKQKYLLLRHFVSQALTQTDWKVFIKQYDKDERFVRSNFPEVAISENILTVPGKINSYDASLIAEFFRKCLLKAGTNFSFETVMSHPSKIQFLKKARQEGFKTYLYFICTQDPEINITRVSNRVYEGGHGIAAKKIRERYYRSLELLADAFLSVDRAFVIDNSNRSRNVILEKNKEAVQMHTTSVPAWAYEYLLKKIHTAGFISS